MKNPIGRLLTALLVGLTLGLGLPAQASIIQPPSGAQTRVPWTPRTSNLFLNKPALGWGVRTQTQMDSFAAYDRLDIQYAAVMTRGITTTFQLAYSNDPVRLGWVLGPSWTVVTTTSDMTETFNFGMYTTVFVTPITVTTNPSGTAFAPIPVVVSVNVMGK